MKTRTIIFIAVIGVMLFTSCKKDEITVGEDVVTVSFYNPENATGIIGIESHNRLIGIRANEVITVKLKSSLIGSIYRIKYEGVNQCIVPKFLERHNILKLYDPSYCKN